MCIKAWYKQQFIEKLVQREVNMESELNDYNAKADFENKSYYFRIGKYGSW